ncbi:UBX domain-containing protein 8-like isoform X2 [Glandiceps talaboti]
MTELGLDWVVFIAFSVVVGSLVFFQSDGSGLLHIAAAGLLCLGVTTFLIHIFSKYFEKWFQGFKVTKRNTSASEQVQDPGYDETQFDRQREAARKKLQEDHHRKATQYDEKILKPRRDAKEKDREDQFYRFAGPAWKGKGNALGTNKSEEESTVRERTARTSREAAAARVLPESVTAPVQRPEIQKPKIKKSITIALKTPLGRTHRRRFLMNYNIQVLIDFMTKLGFHPRIYSICTTYPRQCLTDDVEKTLEDLGLTKDVALVIEEKDISDK